MLCEMCKDHRTAINQNYLKGQCSLVPIKSVGQHHYRGENGDKAMLKPGTGPSHPRSRSVMLKRASLGDLLGFGFGTSLINARTAIAELVFKNTSKL